MDNTRQVLIDARTLLSDKSRWTTGDFAQDKDGLPVPSFSSRFPKAAKFCVLGAVMKCNRSVIGDSYAVDILTRTASKHFDHRGPALVNDDLGYDSTMKLLDLAITEATE